MYGPGCVVVLLLVVPPSNWFWRGQVKIPGAVPFKAASLPLPCSVRDDTLSLRLPVLGRSASHPTPHLPSFGHPCGGASIRTLFFAAVPLGSRQPLWWQRDELSLALSWRCVAFAPGFVLQWRFAHGFCLTLRRGLQRLRFYSGGFLSPASELDASSTLGQGRHSARRRPRIQLLLRQHS